MLSPGDQMSSAVGTRCILRVVIRWSSGTICSPKIVRLVSYTSHPNTKYMWSVKFMLPDKVQANLMNYSNFWKYSWSY